jgi:hypothetical protein
MTDESLSPTLEDAYAEGRADERAAIVEMMLGLYQAKGIMRHTYALYYARLIEQMDIQPKDTNAK